MYFIHSSCIHFRMVFCVKVKEMSAKTFLGNVMVLPEEAGVNGKIILRGKILIIVCLTINIYFSCDFMQESHQRFTKSSSFC